MKPEDDYIELIKIQDKFILVSDGEIKEGDTCINIAHQVIVKPTDIEWANSNSDNLKKVISENPDFSDLKEKDCKTIGWVDVEKLAYKYFALERAERNDDFHKNATEEQKGGLYAQYDKTFTPIYAEGFKTAQSLNDKRFSLEDMKKAIKLVCMDLAQDHQKGFTNFNPNFDILQSLQQTSWDVEVIIENNSIKVTKIL